MAAFPSVKFDWTDLSETPDPVVERTEMERGIPKQQRTASDARTEIAMTVIFDTKTESAAFETWFYTTIHAGQDWFDFTHPRMGIVYQARVVGGSLGALQYSQPTLEGSKRQLKVEFWRSTW